MESLKSNVYLLSMTTYLLIWKTNKYCDISFVNLKNKWQCFGCKGPLFVRISLNTTK